MKRIILFFAVCLGLSVSQTTFADDVETARAASKRNANATIATNVQTSQNSNRSIATNSRKSDNKENKTSRTTKTQNQRVVNRAQPQTKHEVKQRSTAVQPVISQPVNSTKRLTTSRGTSNRAVEPRKNESAKVSRTSAKQKNIKHLSRATELNSEKITNIKSKDYSRCKTVYSDCMDEFCANKDTNLRRCACSSRIHEFDNIKKQLSTAEDKMLDFNQSLLTVSLDKEDATAINVASEGEKAFNKKDKTESEKLLQKITKTLNDSGNSRLNNNLASISLSLNMDTAWDNVDSVSGISTTAKSGLGLYNAARPICIEMAKEVCSDEALSIAESSYKLAIQNDCDTVAKSYGTLYNQAQEKIHESGALLDMARLNIHQQRNSDDILTCKKKILDQLSDESVCGNNLYKCLDTTGQYINPSTGQAFLSTNLYELTSLLQEPVGEEKWSKVDKNKSFVKFLNSKKTFLEPATEQCQNIADTVWKEFLDDALAKIKLAQNSKLEEIRQSCTTLIGECKADANRTISEFDARALSTFSVAANKTVNAMCSDIQESCVALMNSVDGNSNWATGMTGISADITYSNLIETCTQVGRDCIIQQCNGTSGNFALCMNATDDRRIAILTRNACWREVQDCVKSADNLDAMSSTYSASRDEYYVGYTINSTDYNTFASTDACSAPDSKACKITKQIWGDCEYAPTRYSITTNEQLYSASDSDYKGSNKITGANTLLSWFATNTATTTALDSCNANGCALNYHRTSNGTCEQVSANCLNSNNDVYGYSENNGCITNSNEIINVTSTLRNYCAGGILDIYGNCCASGVNSNGICVPDNTYIVDILHTVTCSGTRPECTGDNPSNECTNMQAEYDYLCPNGTTRTIGVYCVHPSNGRIEYQDGTSTNYYCTGTGAFWLMVDEYGNYFKMTSGSSTPNVTMSYKPNNDNECTYGYNNSSWSWTGTGCLTSGAPTSSDRQWNVPQSQEFMIKYN